MNHIIHIYNEQTEQFLDLYSGEYDAETMCAIISSTSRWVMDNDFSHLVLLLDDSSIDVTVSDEYEESNLISHLAEIYDKE